MPIPTTYRFNRVNSTVIAAVSAYAYAESGTVEFDFSNQSEWVDVTYTSHPAGAAYVPGFMAALVEHLEKNPMDSKIELRSMQSPANLESDEGFEPVPPLHEMRDPDFHRASVTRELGTFHLADFDPQQ